MHLLLIAVCVWRVWRGENVIDRLVGADLLSVLMLAVLVLLALITREAIYIDVAIALAALSFIGTIALAKLLRSSSCFSGWRLARWRRCHNSLLCWQS